MKKYLLVLCGLAIVNSAIAEDVVLSDTYASDEDVTLTTNDITEEPFVASQTTNSYSDKTANNSVIAQQIKPAFKNILSSDLSDPLFLIQDNHFMFDTFANYMDSKLRIGQYIGYGINNNFVIHANMLYQIDFTRNNENGFSSTEFGGTYRMNHGNGDSRIISDALFGLKLWGSSHVRTPEYADSSYYAGLRFGRQFAGLSLAGTVKSTWVFDDNRGLSYIDFIPETYFRLKYDWRFGLGFDLRKSTNRHLLSNQEWMNIKLLRQYGNTQWIGRFDYEFESEEIQIGLNIKILF
ncbi:MAG: hypothetical protein IJL05_01870 [Alphaproteobacteria bacterium]|nr:hypothetical protein [Alphaproteobacteria bacterium]